MRHAFRCLPSLKATRVKLPTSAPRPRCPPTGIDPRLCLPISFSARRWDNKYDEKAKGLDRKGLDKHEQEVKVRQHQAKRPWHRENADKPPADDAGRDANSMTKGKLLTTPTRLLKLVLPLPISVAQQESNDSGDGDNARGVSSGETIQPLALLVHPQQPLSYVERLIQAEVPPITVNGKEKIPSVYFRAEDTMGSDNKPTTRGEARARDKKADGTSSRGVGKSGGPTTHVASYSGLGREGPERKRADKSWVRWSSSTEMGDFIRDAARGREFAIEIEGCGDEVRVGVPSFGDRTHYMRVRLRKMSRRIDELARIKHDCDMLAHRGAHRLAKGGFAVLTGWWGVVFFTTFFTDFGWDLVEPVTYLAGLTTIMGGYLWFLYISHDLSYKSAMNVTVSRRQHALYEARGFDLQKWEQLLHDANALRGDIKKVAVEYDVDWDGTSDVSDDVKEVLDKQERKEGRKSETDDDDGSPASEEDTPEDRKSEKEEEEDTGKPAS